MKKITLVPTILLALLLVSNLPANAVPIDLNDFFADPTVTIAADGSTATLYEDSFASAVILSNDPFFGEPEVIFPGLLSFEFNFVETDGDNDQFDAFVIDPDTGGILDGFDFLIEQSSSGIVTFDLSAVLLAGLGLQFQLSALPGDVGLDSTVTISNVRLEMAPVPEPATMILLGSGLVGLLGFGRKKFRKTS